MNKNKESAKFVILKILNQEQYLTPIQIQKIIVDSQPRAVFPLYTLSTVRNELYKMYQEGLIVRKKNVGPRGGYGYGYHPYEDDPQVIRWEE